MALSLLSVELANWNLHTFLQLLCILHDVVLRLQCKNLQNHDITLHHSTVTKCITKNLRASQSVSSMNDFGIPWLIGFERERTYPECHPPHAHCFVNGPQLGSAHVFSGISTVKWMVTINCRSRHCQWLLRFVEKFVVKLKIERSAVTIDMSL